MNTNAHAGHRARLKDRLKNEGASSLDDATLLEILLTYAIPRKDTRRIADDLISRFKTFAAVVEAPAADLVLISGVSEHTALLIKLLPEFADRIQHKPVELSNSFFDQDVAGRFFVSQYRGIDDECVCAICISDGGALLSHAIIKHGDINSASFRIRSLTEFAIKYECSNIMIAHNHPSGTLMPSGSDLDTTTHIANALAANGIHLLQHFICSDTGYAKLIF